jgi:hypothetical protein
MLETLLWIVWSIWFIVFWMMLWFSPWERLGRTDDPLVRFSQYVGALVACALWFVYPFLLLLKRQKR